MIKFIITAVIVYFLIRSIVNKPWQKSQIDNHQKARVDNEQKQAPKSFDDGEFVEYEEVD